MTQNETNVVWVVNIYSGFGINQMQQKSYKATVTDKRHAMFVDQSNKPSVLHYRRQRRKSNSWEAHILPRYWPTLNKWAWSDNHAQNTMRLSKQPGDLDKASVCFSLKMGKPKHQIGYAGHTVSVGDRTVTQVENSLDFMTEICATCNMSFKVTLCQLSMT